MNVNLTPELEQLVRQKAAQSGLDANVYVAKLLGEVLGVKGGGESASQENKKSCRPISERFDEIRQQAPGQVQQALLELPSDFAAEHDHYIYGTPKKHS
jgi:hypothetical protein